MAAGLSERPNPARSTAIARSPAAASTAITVRYKNDQLGSPCSNNTGSPSPGPASTQASRTPPASAYRGG